jgi:hypothetical protein
LNDAVLRHKKNKERSMPIEAGPSAEDVMTMAEIAGLAVGPEAAARIAASIGPALQGFAPVAGTLPFDLEPAHFVAVQNGAAS